MSLLKLFLVFFRIGMFGFGGGYAMLPLIYQASEKYGYLSSAEFSELVAFSQVTPGPIAVNAATYLGYQSAGLTGAIVATSGVVMPSFLLLVVVFKLFQKYDSHQMIKDGLAGIRPVTIGLLVAAAVMIAQESMLFLTPRIGTSLLFMIGAFAFVRMKRVSPIVITIIGACCGALWLR